MNIKDRAIFMMREAAKFLEKNEHYIPHTHYYDGADCDATCIANDLNAAADDLERT